METAVRQSDLQWLRQWLQQELHRHISSPSPIDVRCALKQGNLLVLVQHPASVALDANQTLVVLEQGIRTLDTQLEQFADGADNLPVRLYLRVVGQQQPYTETAFLLAFSRTVPPGIEQHPVTAGDALSSNEPAIVPTAVPTADVAASEREQANEQINETEDGVAPGAIAPSAPPPNHFVEATASSARPIGRNPIRYSQEDLASRLASIPFLARIPLPVLMLCSIVGLGAVASGVFILTRPCVLGECQPLEQAQRLSQQSAQLAHPEASANDVVKAYHQLAEANYLLGTIPSWSPRYEVAQALLQTYGARSEIYGKVVASLQQANSAAQKSQNPPHPLATWREIQQLWQGAIAGLETIPSDSPIYLLAQQKRSEYQRNLAGINQRIRTEQRSQDHIAAARSAAEAAQIRETNAKSVAGWQAAYGTWQVVVTTLNTVSQGTMAYAEAEQLLAIYQPRLTAARNRYLQEKASAEAYGQALQLAQQARLSEQRRQWSQAVEQWRNALANAEQISNGTSYHEQIQALIATYETALSTAQANLRTAVVAQDAETLLSQACAGTSTICSYTMGSGNAIEVRFTSDYDWAVQAIVADSPLPGATATQQALREYINSLLQTFATASQTAQKPIDFYNSEGQVFATYDAQLGGYARR
jgi:hypothetical protein